MNFTTVICCNCGVPFGMQPGYIEHLRESHAWFYCPNGHRQHYAAETEAEKLRRQRDQLQQRLAQRDDEIEFQRKGREHAERSAAAFKGQVTKLKKRGAAGVCPCCNRTFQNLGRHMATQHPDYTEKPPLTVVEGGKASA